MNSEVLYHLLFAVNRNQDFRKPVDISEDEESEDDATIPLLGYHYKTRGLLRSGEKIVCTTKYCRGSIWSFQCTMYCFL